MKLADIGHPPDLPAGTKGFQIDARYYGLIRLRSFLRSQTAKLSLMVGFNKREKNY